MKTTYKLMKGSDEQLWVTIKPLMNDLQAAINQLNDLDITALVDLQEQKIFELKLLGLKTVYEFLGALETEQYLKYYAATHKTAGVYSFNNPHHNIDTKH